MDRQRVSELVVVVVVVVFVAVVVDGLILQEYYPWCGSIFSVVNIYTYIYICISSLSLSLSFSLCDILLSYKKSQINSKLAWNLDYCRNVEKCLSTSLSPDAIAKKNFEERKVLDYLLFIYYYLILLLLLLLNLLIFILFHFLNVFLF